VWKCENGQSSLLPFHALGCAYHLVRNASCSENWNIRNSSAECLHCSGSAFVSSGLRSGLYPGGGGVQVTNVAAPTIKLQKSKTNIPHGSYFREYSITKMIREKQHSCDWQRASSEQWICHRFARKGCCITIDCSAGSVRACVRAWVRVL
jgi:hypothetical protein